MNSVSRAAKLKLAVQFASEECELPSRSRIRKWVKAALKADAEITVRFVDETEARQLNRDYRGRDYASNVLSFLYEAGPPLAGDIALCLPVLREEASALEVSTDARIAHLLVHAVLHLQGYDHESEQDAAIMEALESKIVTSLGFADPYPDETDPALRFSPQSSVRSPQSSPL